ncbi:hypothetical protein QBC44DRAFT_363269 [Cladorrhinum sp. PSN332]|nr:hypothetical protein QBC44DRAFT_363269 [Cladorrhinum sp. PSN332]
MADSSESSFEKAQASGGTMVHIQHNEDAPVGTAMGRIWSYIRDDPSIRWVCVQPTLRQQSVLGLDAQTANLAKDPALDGRVQVLPYPQATQIFVREASPDRIEKLVVCVELEPMLSARGCMLLACLKELVQDMIQNKADNPTSTDFLMVFTIGQDIRLQDGPYRWIAGKPKVWPKMKEYGWSEKPLDLLAFEIDYAATHFLSQNPEAIFAVVSFLRIDDQNQLSDRLWIRSKAIEGLGWSQTTITDQREFDEYDDQPLPLVIDNNYPLKCCMVWVSPSIMSAFPVEGLEHVQVAIYPPIKPVTQLNPEIGVAVTVDALVGEAERRAYRRWLAPALSAGIEVKEISFLLPPGWSEMLPTIQPPAHGSEIYTLALFACSRWPGRNHAEFEVARDVYGHFDQLKWLDALHRLRAMGLIKPLDNGHKITAMGSRTLTWLGRSSSISLEIGCLLAHIDKKTPDATRRVLLSLAAVMIGDMIATRNTKPENPAQVHEAMTNLHDMLGGHAKRMGRYGHLWVKIGVLEKVIRDPQFKKALDLLIIDDHEMLTYHGIGDACQWLKRLESFCQAYKTAVDATPGDELPQLDDAAVRACQQALADAFLTKWIWVPKNWDGKQGVLLARGDPITVSHEDTGLFYPDLYKEGGFLGFAASVIPGDHGIGFQASNFTMLHLCVAKEIMSRVDATSFADAVASIYAHRARIFK